MASLLYKLLLIEDMPRSSHSLDVTDKKQTSRGQNVNLVAVGVRS